MQCHYMANAVIVLAVRHVKQGTETVVIYMPLDVYNHRATFRILFVSEV